jgi:hypothetical protein
VAATKRKVAGVASSVASCSTCSNEVGEVDPGQSHRSGAEWVAFAVRH